jgi:hypothetical protein
MKFTYNGSDERIFPSIAVTVQPGDTFEAPDDFSAANVSPNTTKSKPTVGDE